MSVIFYGASELALVFLMCASSISIPKERERPAKLLAIVSAANAQAYAQTYGGDPEPVSISEILTAARRLPCTPATRRQALSTLSMLHYNCVSNGGTDNAREREVYLALVELLSSAARVAASDLAQQPEASAPRREPSCCPECKGRSIVVLDAGNATAGTTKLDCRGCGHKWSL